MRTKIITASPLEFAEQRWTPIRSIILEAVTEDRIRGLPTKCRKKTITDGVKVFLSRQAVVVVENEACGADCRTFHHHSRTAGDKADQGARLRSGWERIPVGDRRKKWLCKGDVFRRGRSRSDESGNQNLALIDERSQRGSSARIDGSRLDTKLSCGLSNRNVRTAKRPTASESHVDSKPETPSLSNREPQCLKV